MARVFISYRRADGQYAVGWIAERLRRTGIAKDVDIAFRDADLRCGDDYPDALAARVEQCDVLIAVIGPNWHGNRDDGPARILDPADWVGREITAALGEKTILPILVDGAEPLDPGDLLPEHEAFARLHAIRFREEADLDDFVEDLESQLHDIDVEAARERGLEDPVELASLWPDWRLALVALIAAAAAAVIRTVMSSQSEFVAGTMFDGLAAFHVALGAALTVLLVGYHHATLRPLARTPLAPVAGILVVATGVLLWMNIVYDGTFRGSEAGLSALLVAVSIPVIPVAAYIVLGVGWLEPTGQRHELGLRIRMIAEYDRATILVTVVVCLWASLGIFTSQSVGDPFFHTTAAAMQTLAISAAVVWSRTRLDRESVALASDLGALHEPHRSHVTDRLVTDAVRPDQWWLVLVLITPLLSGILRTVIDSG